MNTRYPRIRRAYAGAAFVHALDRVDALASAANPGTLVHVVLVPYLDVVEAALADQSKSAGAADALLRRTLEGVQQALEAFGLLEAEPNRLLH